MSKVFKEYFNVGSARYCISYHDGKKMHADGSKMFDIRLFNNGKSRDKFIRDLVKDGYTNEKEDI